MTYYYFEGKRYILALLLLCAPFFGFSQTDSNDSESLLTLRNELIANNQSTKEVDLQLYQLNIVPSAVVHMLDANTFQFPTYQFADEQRELRVNSRLPGVYSYLTVADYNEDFSSVTIHCNTPVTTEMINELVAHFGYNGHEIH